MIDDWKQVAEHKEKPLMDLFTKKPGKVFVDVGAHAGRWTLPMAHLFERTVVFEPNPDAYDRLVDNVVNAKIIMGKLEAYQLGVSDRPGMRELCELDGVPSRSTVYPEHSGLQVTHRWSMLFVTLDAWEGRLGEASETNLLKVDVEGSELDVLRGAERILKKWKPRLCIETHSERLYQGCSRFLERVVKLPFTTVMLDEEAPASCHAGKGEKHKYIVRA